MKTLKKMIAIPTLAAIMLLTSIIAFAETDNKVREMANETRFIYSADVLSSDQTTCSADSSTGWDWYYKAVLDFIKG